MAAPRQPPELVDDAIAEILIRFPPEDPACLAPASLVCKSWCRLLSDHGFRRRYREFHGVPPLLGFLHSTNSIRNEDGSVYRFVPTSGAPPLSLPPHDEWGRGWVLDCRHGRVLIDEWDASDIRLAVRDPIACDRKVLPSTPRLCIPIVFYDGVVLCSAGGGCDHLDCHGGPFRVVLLCSNTHGAGAWVYSSETGAWSAPAIVSFSQILYMDCWCRAVLVGDDHVYFRTNMCGKILEYDLDKHCLSVIGPPPFGGYHDCVLMVTEDDLLGAAIVMNSCLHMWSREVKPEGDAVWVHRRAVELETLLPARRHQIEGGRVVCFAEGLGIVLVTTDIGLFSIDLKSWRVRKVCKPMDCGKLPVDCGKFIPFMSFYTPGVLIMVDSHHQ